MNKKTKKKLILAALAALASGGVIYAVRKRREEDGDEKSDGDGNIISVPPPISTYDGQPVDTNFGQDEEIFGGEGSGGGGGGGVGGGGGGGANMTLCRGLDAEGNEKANLVNAGEDCPADTPYSDDIEYDDFVYDSFNCFAYDEESEEVIAQEKDFTEVCGVDYPDFPFNTLNDALTYAQNPSAFDGCTDESALNYDETAMLDDGSCIMEGDEVQGCTDEDALNFDEFANVDDGSCQFGVTRDEISNVAVDCGVDATQGLALINLDAIAQVDGEDILALDEVNDIIGFECYNALGEVIADNQVEEETEPILGCTDETATNFKSDATEDDGSCLYNDLEGCTDPTATNYFADATIDDGSCQYDVIEVQGCTDPTAMNFDSDATEDDGSCEYESVLQPEQRTCYFFDDQQTIMEAYFNLLPDETCWNDVSPITTLSLLPTTRNGYFDSVEDAVAYLTGMSGFMSDEVPAQMCVILDPTLPYPEGVSQQELPSDFEQCDEAFGEFSYPLNDSTEAQAEIFLDELHQEWLLTQTTLCYGYNSEGVFEQDVALLSQNAESCTEVGLFDTYEDAESAFTNEFVAELDEPLVGYIDSIYVAQNLVSDCPFTTNVDALGFLGLPVTDGAYLIDDVNSVIGYECYDTNTGLPSPPPVSDFGCTDPQASNYDSSAVLDSGLCEYLETEIPSAEEGTTSIPMGVMTSNELSAGLNSCQNPPSIVDILGSATAQFGDWGSGYLIDEVNDIIGYECFDENAQPTGTPPEPESNIEPADFQEPIASVDNSSTLTTAQLGTLDACPTTMTGATMQILTASSITARQANEILGTACFDEVTGENLYYEAPAENLILSGATGTELFIQCMGGTIPEQAMGIALSISSASYPMTAQDFNGIIGFNCLNPDTAQVVNPLLTPEPEMPNSQVDSGTSAPTGGGSTSPQDVIDDNTLTPEPNDVVASDFEDIGIDNDILADANTPPSTIVGQSSQDLSTENSLNSLGQRNQRNFSGQGLQNGGCLDPIALNYDEFAEFDDGTCMY